MSSTYVHYSTPSSLPSDYALLSRYAAAPNIRGPPADNDEALASEEQPAVSQDDVGPGEDEREAFLRPHTRRVGRRSSFPTSYIRPINPTMAPLPNKFGHRSGPHQPDATETTPLLGPLVPRIQEEVDDEDLRPGSEKRQRAIWEEIKILSKYTLPVFG